MALPHPTFIRILYPEENKEVLFNVAHISKIEVRYGVGSSLDRDEISLEAAAADPRAVRYYTVHVAGEELNLEANPDDPVLQVLGDIYNASVKGKLTSSPPPLDPPEDSTRGW
jgi:hypothetical protein